MQENRGWIKLYRKLADNDLWLSESFTRGQAWVDRLLLANHKTGFIRRRGIMVKVGRGQVGYSEEALAKRWCWSKGKVRRFFSELAGRSMISRQTAEIAAVPKKVYNFVTVDKKTIPKKTSVNNLICIENYDKYQGNGTEDGTEDGTGTRSIKNEKENPPVFSETGIHLLEDRYQNPGLIGRVFQAIAGTRKTGKIADSVKVKILQSWSKYPTEQVLTGLQTYLSKDYAAAGKGERYLAGIIKNTHEKPKIKQVMPEWF